jgi:UbiD family decarboxylase
MANMNPMTFTDLRTFLRHLEACGQLVRVQVPVDPDQELTIIQHRVLACQGPALLFEKVKGSPYRIVSNLFGTQSRVEMVMGGSPGRLGERILRLSRELMPPTLKKAWHLRKDLLPLSRVRLQNRSRGPILESLTEPADLFQLPVLTCWPLDGGPFFTLPLVLTRDPQSGQANLGIYRLQRFSATATGMHWQIERGGGFHFHKACQMGRPLPVSVILGGPPAMIIAAIAPMPEGIDERLLASYLMGVPLEVILRKTTGHRIPAAAEFVLEGMVSAGDVKREGPFGDHFGHYSQAADYPVFRVDRVLSRKDAIYPATVVGKPVQEDYYIGQALQELTLPLLKMIRPAVTDLWAYPQTGFHPLAVMAVSERYPHEALKHTLGLLGEGQVSMTKVMITVGPAVDVRDFVAVSRALWKYLDPESGIHLLVPTAQDTLDFTGPAMNTGSRLLLIAMDGTKGPLRTGEPPPPPAASDFGSQVKALTRLGPAFLIVQTDFADKDIEDLRQALCFHPVARHYLFHVLVSCDVPLDDPTMVLWGWFTRFDPSADLYPAQRHVRGNRLVFDFPILIDARWKKGYPNPVEFDPAVERRVNEKWKEYGIP